VGITQKELAALAGASMGTVLLWEKGKIQPREEKKAVLAGLKKMKKGEVKKSLKGKIRLRNKKSTYSNRCHDLNDYVPR
jgi:transcriptional regulator with XRE-family HTH domain